MGQKKTKRILYLLATQYENLGDFVINRLLIQELQRFGIVEIVDHRAPEEFRVRMQNAFKTSDRLVRSNWSARSLRFYFEAIFKHCYDVVVTSPGTQGTGEGLSQALGWLPRYLALMALRISGAKLMCFGISVGRLSGLSGLLTILRLRLYSCVGVRSKDDEFNLKRWLNQSVKYCPDLAVLLDTSRSKGLVELDELGPYVVFSFRSVIAESSDPSYTQSIIEAASIAINSVLKSRSSAVLAYQVGRDRDLLLEIAQHWSNEPRVILLDKLLSEDDALTLYKNAELVISNRLHVLLFASVQETPIMCLSHPEKHQKIIGIFNDFRLASKIYNFKDLQHVSEDIQKVIQYGKYQGVRDDFVKDDYANEIKKVLRLCFSGISNVN